MVTCPTRHMHVCPQPGMESGVATCCQRMLLVCMYVWAGAGSVLAVPCVVSSLHAGERLAATRQGAIAASRMCVPSPEEPPHVGTLSAWTRLVCCVWHVLCLACICCPAVLPLWQVDGCSTGAGDTYRSPHFIGCSTHHIARACIGRRDAHVQLMTRETAHQGIAGCWVVLISAAGADQRWCGGASWGCSW